MGDEAVAGKKPVVARFVVVLLWMRLISGTEACLCARTAAGGRRPARESHTRAFGSESSISKPGRPAAAHRHPARLRPRGPRGSPPCNLRLGVVDLALRALQRPPHRWGFHCRAISHLAAHGTAAAPTQPGPASRCPLCGELPLGVVRFEARPSPLDSLRYPPHRWGFHCCAISHPGARRSRATVPPLPTARLLFVPQLTRCLHIRCLVCWWVIGVVLASRRQVLPPPTGTQPGTASCGAPRWPPPLVQH